MRGRRRVVVITRVWRICNVIECWCWRSTQLRCLLCDSQVCTHLSTAASSFNTHSSRSGSTGDDDDLALQREHLREGVGLWDIDRHVESRVCDGYHFDGLTELIVS